MAWQRPSVKQLVWKRLETQCIARMSDRTGRVTESEAAEEAHQIFRELGARLSRKLGRRVGFALRMALHDWGLAHRYLQIAGKKRMKLHKGILAKLNGIEVRNLAAKIGELKAGGEEALELQESKKLLASKTHPKHRKVEPSELQALRDGVWNQRIKALADAEALAVIRHARNKVLEELSNKSIVDDKGNRCEEPPFAKQWISAGEAEIGCAKRVPHCLPQTISCP